MQIIQPLLGTKVNPLGQRKPLCDPNRLLLKKESDFLHGYGLSRKIATQSPLINYSKFLLSKRRKVFIEPLGWDTSDSQNFDAESPSFEFEPFNSISEDNTKSDVSNEVEQFFGETETRINLNQDGLLTADESVSAESQIHTLNDTPSLQQHSDSGSTTSDSDAIATTSIPSIPTLPNVEEPILFSNLVNNQPQVIPELASGKSAELLTTVNAPEVLELRARSQHNTTFENTTSESAKSTPVIPLEPQTSSPPLQAAGESHTGGRFETTIDNTPDLISNSTRSDAVASNSVESPPLSSIPSSPGVEDTLTLFRHVANEEQPLASELPLTVPTPESSKAVNTSDVVNAVVSQNHTLPQNNIYPNITPSKSTESIPILSPPTSPATSDVIATEEIAKTTQLQSIPSTETVEDSSSEVVENTPLHSAATKPNVAETSTVFSNFVNNEQQVVSDLLPGVTNTEFSTTVNTSNTLESPNPGQNEEDSLPSEAEPKIDFDKPVPQGFATGGHVTTTYVNKNQQIAPSDTVHAMLTPGEFVINAKDAQKNLNLLQHINTGGIANDTILTRRLDTSNPKEQVQTTAVDPIDTSNPKEQVQTTAVDPIDTSNPKEQVQTTAVDPIDTSNPKEQVQTTAVDPTKVDSLQDTSLQLKNENISSQVSNSLISSSLGLEIGKQRRSILSSPELNMNVSRTTDVAEPSFNYSSPSLIFRQKNQAATNTPSQWSSVEELLNGSADVTDVNFSGVESNQHSEFSQVTSHASKSPSESPKVFAKHLPQPQGFADGGEVTTDINTNRQPITETIERPSPASKEDDDANLEVLAREIYSRLRQRLEIERERYGVYSGRLPW